MLNNQVLSLSILCKKQFIFLALLKNLKIHFFSQLKTKPLSNIRIAYHLYNNFLVL